MRWRYNLVVLCSVLILTVAEPDPKKYKDTKDKQPNKNLTEEEKLFLREIETKFGIKKDPGDIPSEQKSEDEQTDVAQFPTVIAIEIVNDTDSNTNKKRTIDANLGYGYRTNSGYTYNYFGKPSQEKGKFMIYPYSQEDIPPPRPGQYQQYGASTPPPQHYEQSKSAVSDIQIQPSQAYELVPIQNEAYNYRQQLTESNNKYERVTGQETPPPPPTHYPVTENPQASLPSQQSTLYTTYNAGQFSGLSGSFPTIMSNYLVDSSQLLRHPHFQNAGLTSEHLRPHEHQLAQRVVPVLVLRIPSSQLRNPTAELYPNLPQNYPLSQHLNTVDIQKLVNQYFRKLGYPHVPQVMSYQRPTTVPANYETQQYAVPQVRPSYTHADTSGVQYSAVQPVMAKYPVATGGYPTQQYYVPQAQPLYHHVAPEPQYQYQYQYVQPTHTYYMVRPQYQQEQTESHSVQQEETSSGYEQEVTQDAAPEYESHKTPTPEYGPTKIPVPVYGPSEEVEQSQTVYGPPTESLATSTHTQHTSAEDTPPKETLAIYPSQANFNAHTNTINYVYQHQLKSGENLQGKRLQLSENYPSPDHTKVVLPISVPAFSHKPRRHHGVSQRINYVTPTPYTGKHPYRMMVPQIVFRNEEKVAYVNSHSVPTQLSPLKHSTNYSKEVEYAADSSYVPQVGSHRPTIYTRNYHSHPKRMIITDKKKEAKSVDLIIKKS